MTTVMCLSVLLATANGLECPPPIDQVCWSVTSYWPFDENGGAIAGNGQADSQPNYTANMTYITPNDEWSIAAVPFDLVGVALIFPNGHTVYAADTFGNPTYQAGVFYHDYWKQWVMGVDILSPDPFLYLECGGGILP
jgi:hypothetical protein